MKGYKPNLSNDDIRQIIRLSADDNIVPGYDPIYGYGRINAGRALSYLTNPYTLVQNTASSGTVISTSNQYVAQFISAPGLPTGNYLVKRIEIQKTVTLPDNVYNVTGVWGRGVFTSGWSAATPNFGEGFCEVVPGSLTGTSMTLRTYVYQVWSIIGSYLGYYPTSPSNATFAYSVLGLEKPTISGPTTICDQATYTIENLPPGAVVQWSVHPSLSIVSRTNNSIVVSSGVYPQNILTDAWVRAQTADGFINQAINNIVVWKLGITQTEDLILGWLNEYGGEVQVAESIKDLGQNYRWSSSVDNWEPTMQGYYFTQFFGEGNLSGGEVVDITVEFDDPCGNRVYMYRLFNIEGQSPFSLTPNPASDVVTISLNEESRQGQNRVAALSEGSRGDSSSIIQLWSSLGLLKQVSATVQTTYRLDLTGIAPGFYQVLLIKGGETYRRQLVVR